MKFFNRPLMKVTLKQAVQILKNGGVVAIPTETVYGLAARLCDVPAIKKIFVLKKRPADNPLIVHIANLQDLALLTKEIPATFKKLKKFWPGPLTVVLPARLKSVPSLARAGLKTVAIRVPAHPLTRDLIRKTGPLVAPSANVSGRPSATTAFHVEEDFGPDFPILDGGPCRAGVESTVILLKKNGWSLLRSGALTEEELTDVLGLPLRHKKGKRPISPGQKYRHYAPHCRLVLCHTAQELKRLSKKEGCNAVLGFDETVSVLPLLSLGSRLDPQKNLRLLYATLRVLDERKDRLVLVDMDFAKQGLGATLAERLTKASAEAR